MLIRLIERGCLRPGEQNLKLDFRGQTFFGSLLPDGRIKFVGPDGRHHFYASPTAFCLAMKRSVWRNFVKESRSWSALQYRRDDGKFATLKDVWEQYLQNSAVRREMAVTSSRGGSGGCGGCGGGSGGSGGSGCGSGCGGGCGGGGGSPDKDDDDDDDDDDEVVDLLGEGSDDDDDSV